MKASEVIERLQELIKLHGDKPVNYFGYTDAPVSRIEAYDAGGNRIVMERYIIEKASNGIIATKDHSTNTAISEVKVFEQYETFSDWAQEHLFDDPRYKQKQSTGE